MKDRNDNAKSGIRQGQWLAAGMGTTLAGLILSAGQGDPVLGATSALAVSGSCIFLSRGRRPKAAPLPQTWKAALARPSVETALLRCDLEREMSIVLQPIRDLRSGRIERVEALARWTSAELGPVTPDIFITTAERIGLMSALTLTLLRKTLEAAKRLPDDVGVAFNLSANDITDSRTVLSIVTLVRGIGMDPRRITFEMTETAAVRQFQAAGDAIRLFRAMGMRIALDDFGTGYAGLSYLNHLTFDEVKIDKSFLTKNGALGQTRRFLSAVVGLCAGLDLPCLVEGVETHDQLAMVEDVGAAAYQGYLLARPMVPDALCAWLQAETAARTVQAQPSMVEDAARASA